MLSNEIYRQIESIDELNNENKGVESIRVICLFVIEQNEARRDETRRFKLKLERLSVVCPHENVCSMPAYFFVCVCDNFEF